MRNHTLTRLIRIVNLLRLHLPFISVRQENHRAFVEQLAAARALTRGCADVQTPCT